nr:preprotein translocase subunit SecB [uncultured bacterium]
MEKAQFQFEGFKIKKSLIDINKDNNLDLSIKFRPSGVLNKKDSIFILTLDVVIKDSEKLNIEISSESFFNFSNIEEERLSKFIYINAPSIMFPYLRAYISSLTALSGISPITLPTLNLSGLRDELKSNTVIL